MVYGKIIVEDFSLFMPFEKICEYCSTTFEIQRKSQAAVQRFCSQRCYHDAKAGIVTIGEITLKTCSECGETKPLDGFFKMTSRVIGVQAKCKDCRAAYKAKTIGERRVKNRERRQANKAYYREKYKQYRQTLKKRTIDNLGGVCACCGIEDIRFLCVDHINNDGAAHRKSLFGNRRGGCSTKVYRAIHNEGYPRDKYQPLCFNCNMAKSFYGTCPHQEDK